MMRPVRRLVLHAVYIAVALVAAVIASPATALAQTQGSALTGAVLDPSGQAVAGAGIVVRNDALDDIHATTTDGTGHFSVTDLRAGTYTVEVGAPGFDIVRKTGIRVAESGPAVDTVIQLSLANITETVTVSTALPAAAVAAPSQGSLTARSAQSLISNEYIRNYTSPFSDYSQVLQMAPGTFSVSANGPGLSDTKTFFRGFPGRFLQHDVRRYPVQRHERSDAPLVGVLPGADDRLDRVRSQPGIGSVDRTVHLRRFGQPALAAVAIAADAERHGVVRVVQHAAVRRGVRLRQLRHRRKVAPAG